MTQPTFRIGIIGCGNICNQYFAGLGKFPFLKIVGVADLDPARAEAKAKEHGVRAYKPDELLAEGKVDLVLNLTVPKAHGAVNLSALKAGKNVYTEKPFALKLPEARRVLKLAKSSGLRVGCAPDTFLGGGIQTARGLIDAGAIGEPVAAVANFAGHGCEGWHPDPEFFYLPGGGPMLDMGPYYLTALVNLLGPIKRVTGSTRKSFDERVIGSEKEGPEDQGRDPHALGRRLRLRGGRDRVCHHVLRRLAPYASHHRDIRQGRQHARPRSQHLWRDRRGARLE